MQKKDVPAELSMRVVELLRQERLRRGISLNELATASSLSRTMVSYVERGMRNPTLDTLFRMAGALDTDLWKVLKAASTHRRRPTSHP